MTSSAVAFLIEYYRPFEVGGAERSAAALASALASRGIEVTILTPRYGRRERDDDQGIRVVQLPFPQRIAPGQLARRLYLANPLLQLFHAVLVASWVRRCGAAVLHVQNSQMVITGALASMLVGRPMVVTIRDLAYLSAQTRNRYSSGPKINGWKAALDAQYAKLELRMKRRALRHARGRVFVSRGLQQLYAAEGLDREVKGSTVVYNIGPRRDVQPRLTARSKTVLFVGKLSTGKGLHVLYAAVRDIITCVPGAVVELVGEPGVGWAAPPPSCAANIRLCGRLDSDAVRQKMREARVLVAPSIWPEPLSRVLLEAMSVGLPIVAAAVGGSVEALDADSAVLIPPDDAAALASAVCRILQDDAYADRLSAAAAARYDRLFTAEHVVPALLDVYRQAL